MNRDFIFDCLRLNKSLPENGLVKLTWGNASVISDCRGVVAIKPSGVDFEELKETDISLISMDNGSHVFGKKPSVDSPIHLEIYRAFPNVKSVIHTHSKFATSWAQAQRSIPTLGTTHADYFDGDIPICDHVSDDDLNDYETNLGKKIVGFFVERGIDPLKIPAILIPFHGCLVFSDSADKALEVAIVLEEVAEMATYTNLLGTNHSLDTAHTLFRKHFERKNGKSKYYGQ